MSLVEEYYKRHKINIPIIKHIDHGSLFFRSKNFPNWKVFRISWREKTNYPGNYFATELIVSKNSVTKDHLIEFHEYEDYLINFKSKFNLEDAEVLTDKREIILFGWELFVYWYEKYLINKFFHLEKHIFNSVNKNNSIDVRYASYLNFHKDCTTSDGQGVGKLYQTEIAPYIDSYLYWLAETFK